MAALTYHAALLAVIAAPAEDAKAGLLTQLLPPPDGATWDLPELPVRPGRSAQLREGEPPRRRRGLDHKPSRLHFLHAIYHIELSAIDLACLLCLRASGAPAALHADFLQIAREEAVHAGLVRDLLISEGFPPGSDPVHHKLWESALAAADLGGQLVVVPRYLEARGLDVSAELLPRLCAIDAASHAVISRIYQDEIGHVGVGTRWHAWWCTVNNLDPATHFAATVQRHFAGQVPGPFTLDRAGRCQAGFRPAELELLTAPPWKPCA